MSQTFYIFNCELVTGQIGKVWNIKDLRYQVTKIPGFENRNCDHCTSPFRLKNLETGRNDSDDAPTLQVEICHC